jgi:hypothetical protein
MLLSYGQGELVYNNASTVTLVYRDGTLKMYTCHVAQSLSPGARLEPYDTSQTLEVDWRPRGLLRRTPRIQDWTRLVQRTGG